MSSYRILYHHRIRAEDGQAVHVRELIRALRQAGHEVLECALVPKAGATSPSAPASLWQRLRLPRLASELLEILYTRRGLAMLHHAARDFRPDFIYERHALHCKAGLLAARALEVPLLLEVNAPICAEMKNLGLLRFPRLASSCERQVLAGADRVLPVSGVLAGMLEELGADGDRLRLVRNGAVTERHDAAAGEAAAKLRQGLELPPGALVAGFIGFLRPWHRLDLVLQAMGHAELQELHLMLAGDGPALTPLKAQARELGLLPRLHCLGTVTPDEIPGICAAMDLALLVAINDYASPLKLFDYLAAGVATLCVDQPNIRELIQDGKTGVLFAAGNLDSLSQRLGGLCHNPELRQAIGDAGREALLAGDWTWAGNARRVVQAYEELRA